MQTNPPIPKPHIFLGLPSHEFVSPLFVQALQAFALEAQFSLSIKWNVGDGVMRARNTLTADFLATDCTHLLFVDTDLIFSAEQVQRMLDHSVELVAGFYPKKADGPLEWCCNTPDAGVEPPLASGLQRMKYMGTGFMLIERSVFERMRESLDLWYTADGTGRTEWEFWPMAVHRFPDGMRRLLSEDWYFCQRCLDLGIPVWGDTRVILRHIGQAVFPLQSQQHRLVAGADGSGEPPVPAGITEAIIP